MIDRDGQLKMFDSKNVKSFLDRTRMLKAWQKRKNK